VSVTSLIQAPPAVAEPCSMRFCVSPDRTVTITARMLSAAEALELLEYNTRNRTLRQSDVDAIAADIVDGEWQFTGDTIKLARGSDGTFLADAQHRLAGIAKSGLAVPVIIVNNLDPAITETIDQGRPRAVGDILRMTYGRQLIRNESIISGIAALHLALMRPGRHSRKVVAEHANQNFDLFSEWASWAKGISSDSGRVAVTARRFAAAMSPGPVAVLAIHMVNAGADVELVKEFFSRTASGLVADSDRTNVIAALRKRQKNGIPLSRVDGGGSSAQHVLAEFCVYVSAFNRWVSGERVEMIKSSKAQPADLSQLPPIAPGGLR